jgi:predicted small metal-binding protein
MLDDKALRCECGYEVQASDEAARVDEVRRHASETHGIDLSADLALDVVRRVRLVPSRLSPASSLCIARHTRYDERHIDDNDRRADRVGGDQRRPT